MVNIVIQEVKSQRSIAIVAKLAREIWTEHYVPIIGKAQVRYMLRTIQSRSAIADQIRGGYRYFLIKCGIRYAGYVAVAAECSKRRMYLSKLYVKKSFRGRGLALAAIDYVDKLCRKRRFSTIWLNVNKNNPSVGAYKRLGFRKTGVMVKDIGNGFVMDDFRMEKKVL